MDLDSRRKPLDAPALPDLDGELSSQVCSDGRVLVEVIEHLRVSVPAAARQAWYEAEEASWEPWLRSQPGFLGRQLHWDAEREEGQLLIRWASRAQWHAIPRAEIERVQERFERLAHAALERLGVVAALADDGDRGVLSSPTGMAPLAGPAAAGSSPAAGAPAPAPPAPRRPANPFPLVFSGELAPDALPEAP